MRNVRYGMFALLLCFVLLLGFAPLAWAEDTAGYETRLYGKNVIVGFAESDFPLTVDTEYKYALVELQKEFPVQLTVLMGGTAFYTRGADGELSLHHVDGAVTQDIDVSWKCAEDYDEDLDIFHFVPVLSEAELAEGVELPILTVNVLGRIEGATMPLMEEKSQFFSGSTEVYFAPGGTALPASYNNYENGNLPPIRDQNPYGTCWAFGTIAAVEADLIHDGTAGTGIDLSELHTIYYTYHDFYDEKGCNIGDNIALNGANYLDIGGSPFNAGLTLTNMLGPVYESTVPYGWASSYAPGPYDGRIGNYQISNMYLFDLNDQASVKQAIMDHGAVSASYNSNWSYYSSTCNSYYYPTSIGTNHIVALVGWDDNFSKNNFRSNIPEGDGAWLVRNSWGTDEYGYGGYFWMSYYDKSLYRTVYGYDVQPLQYSHCYAFDNSPSLYRWSVDSSSNVAQRFWVDGGEDIEAIGVFCETGSSNLQFTVTCGTESRTAYLVIGTPGYYLVPLSSPLSIIERSEVTVDYVISAGTSSVYVNSEGPGTYSGYSGNTGYNVAFNATRGSGMIINEYLTDSDACIKLFTNDMTYIIEPDFILPDDLNEIGEEAFSGTFTYAKLPDRPVVIGRCAFANCPDLAYILIPPQVTDISPDAFEGLGNLTILGVDSGTT